LEQFIVAKKATIGTIAEVTGLSLATVSRALSGSDAVLPHTRDKVLQVAKRLNYVRDRAAVRLKTGKTWVVAFIMDRRDVNQPAFKDLLLGVSDTLSGTEYHMIVLPDDKGSDPLASLRYVVERGLADAIVISHISPEDPRVKYLLDKKFPFCTHGRTRLTKTRKNGEVAAVEHPFVDFANEAYADAAVAALVARGRKRLGILLPHEGATFRQHLLEGFTAACKKYGAQGQAVSNLDTDGSPDHIYSWAAKQAKQYDGLVATRESILVALMGGLTDCGLTPGAQIDVVSKYSTSLPLYMRQPLLGCFEDIALTGRLIAQNILHQLGASQGGAPANTLLSPPTIEVLHEQTKP
jgi:LacI family transcriptional regulator